MGARGSYPDRLPPIRPGQWRPCLPCALSHPQLTIHGSFPAYQGFVSGHYRVWRVGILWKGHRRPLSGMFEGTVGSLMIDLASKGDSYWMRWQMAQSPGRAVLWFSMRKIALDQLAEAQGVERRNCLTVKPK